MPPPTLLVFTLGPEAECGRKRLLPRALGREERRLHARCLEEVVAAGRAAGCRVLVSAPPGTALPAGAAGAAQEGRGFADRLERAIVAAREETDGPLLVVGSDLPGLTAAALRRAVAALIADPESVVLGPSPDGGLYLLAGARPLPGLAAVRWCSRHALADLRALLAREGRAVRLLAPLADLDHARDLGRLLRRRRRTAGPWRSLLAALARLLAGLARVATPPRPALAPCPVPRERPGRAPPR